jgi:UDP-N-acetyl-alpha-D-muramoyl-L-alanyl-L-glutamate epimerase
MNTPSPQQSPAQTGPAMGETAFTISPWAVEEERLTFTFQSGRYGDFAETLDFPGCAAALAKLSPGQRGLADLLSAALGVSYYKATAGGQLEAPALPAAAQDLVRALYIEGLGEFYVRNKLPYPPAFELAAATAPSIPSTSAASAAPRKAIVAFGGGMDSHVALALVERAGLTAELTSVSLSDNIARVISDCTDRKVTFVARRLDPRLLAANKAGALNGHIPVTAIHSLILVLYASLTGADWVVLANEKSADEATMKIDGHEVNHQFSKTFRAEGLIRGAVKALLPDGPDYFSVLRPVSELWIARELAELTDALAKFRSCNRNFVFSDQSRQLSGARWCGVCAKCVFTAIITAPFVARAQAKALFGSDVLDNPDNLPLAEELAGFTDAKPWECVGTIGEVSAALAHLGADPEWREAHLVEALSIRVRERDGSVALARRFSASLMERGDSFLPPQMRFINEPEAV